MDGWLRAGAWIALVCGVHVGAALSVPLWQTEQPERPWAITVRLTHDLVSLDPVASPELRACQDVTPPVGEPDL